MSSAHNNISYGLLRRVEMPMSLRAYLGGHLRNYMWRVETEASKVGQMGTQQAPTVVWSSSLPRCPSSQSGCRSCLIVTQTQVTGLGYWYTTFLSVPGRKWLAVEGISSLVLAVGGQAFSGEGKSLRIRAPRAGEGK